MPSRFRALTPLFRFEDERAALVEINASGTGRAVAVLKRHRLFKDVSILVFVGFGWFGSRDFEYVAEFGEENLVVGALCRTG